MNLNKRMHLSDAEDAGDGVIQPLDIAGAVLPKSGSGSGDMAFKKALADVGAEDGLKAEGKALGMNGPDDFTCPEDNIDPRMTWKSFLKYAGPGIMMSTAFIDPGDLEGDLQAGASYRYELLWIYLWCTVMGFFMEMIAAKMGVACGKDLALLCREQYTWPVRYALWIAMEIALIAVEIQYIIGAAVGLSLMCGAQGANLPLWGSVLICWFLSYVVLMLDYWKVKWVEIAFYLMIVVMLIMFVVLAGVAGGDGVAVLRGMTIPNLPQGTETALLAGGIVGGALSPYNFFFFSSLVIKRDLPLTTRGEKRVALKYFAIEAGFALFLALLMNICIVSTFADAFYGTDMADEAGLLNAGTMLGQVYGSAYTYIWAVGLFATGVSSAAGSIYAGQCIMGGFLDIKLPVWQRAMFTRTVAAIPAIIVAATQKSDQTEIDTLNLWLNLTQTIALPFAMIPLMHFTCSLSVMGPYWRNGWAVFSLGVLFTLFGVFMAIYGTWFSVPMPKVPGTKFVAILGVVIYCALIVYFSIAPDRVDRWAVTAWNYVIHGGATRAAKKQGGEAESNEPGGMDLAPVKARAPSSAPLAQAAE